MYTFSMSVRKIKKSYISCTGYFASLKNKNPIPFESVLERDFYMHLEFDKNVRVYDSQPFRIKYEMEGRKTRYTPDVLVEYNDGSKKVFEVKYSKEIEESIYLQNKLNTLKIEINNKMKLELEIFTDNDIDKNYLLNAKFLYKFAFLSEDLNYSLEIRKKLKETISPISVESILNEFSFDKEVQLKYIPFIWMEVFKNISLIDMNIKLSMKTQIFRRNYNE